LAPISSNGLAKLFNEHMIRECAESWGLDYAIVRAFNTFGGQDRFSILAHLKTAYERGEPFTMFNEGRSQRDFVHVEDLATVLLGLLERDLPHRVLNVGTGRATRIADIVAAFRQSHPDLKTVSKYREETEYSRADITRLRAIFPELRFRSVLDFLRGEV
jgi:UDP-glucose 4-epimerase